MKVTICDHDREYWMDRASESAIDLRRLCRTLAPLLPGIPLACVCNDWTCPRCELERIVKREMASDKQAMDYIENATEKA